MTIGVDFVSKTFQLSDGLLVNCLIYDTGGQEKFKSINTHYYRKANAILLLYDITDKSSFEDINDFYIKEIRERCNKNIPVALVGNKLDLDNQRKVLQEDAIFLARTENYIFRETSCKTNENVANVFESLIELWNSEEKKKRQVGERSNSGEFIKNKKRENKNLIFFDFEKPTTTIIPRTKKNELSLDDSFHLDTKTLTDSKKNVFVKNNINF